MPKNLELSGLIHSHFDSEAQFAKAMGWPRQRLNRIVNGKKIPTLFEIGDMAEALPYDFMGIVDIFLRNGTTNVDKTGG